MYNQNLHFHFIGIGGSGMSGIAEILLDLGFKVSGSDLSSGDAVQRLISKGACFDQGHAPENLDPSVSLVVFSSAVTDSNPEIVEARTRGIPIVRRAEVLAELMRLKFAVGVAGSHGKTTTTSMVAEILETAELDPTVIIGGKVLARPSGGKLGQGKFLVAETDESDRSFLLLHPTLAVVTNIDHEHLNAYHSFAELESAFEQFIRSVPFYGLAVLCIDDPRVRELAGRYERRKLTYGFSPDAQVRGVDVVAGRNGTTCTVLKDGAPLFTYTLPVLGKHLALNALAAIAVGLEFGIEPQSIKRALESFSGVQRRLEIVGSESGVTIINDYAHHPTEIRATLSAVRAAWQGTDGRIHVVFQPHRYTRTQSCFADFLECFGDADTLCVTDIYAASEEPIPGITGEVLERAINHPNHEFVSSYEGSIPLLTGRLRQGDVVVCLGAGSINSLPALVLSALRTNGVGNSGLGNSGLAAEAS